VGAGQGELPEWHNGNRLEGSGCGFPGLGLRFRRFRLLLWAGSGALWSFAGLGGWAAAFLLGRLLGRFLLASFRLGLGLGLWALLGGGVWGRATPGDGF
jgi:hypothetical protein